MYAKDWISRPHPELKIIPEEDSVGGMDDVTPVPDRPFTPPIPIVNVSPKIGRNEPCPCGSGKKYKKCCGRAVQDQVQNPS
jgi:preprotein translocase subunit SecA